MKGERRYRGDPLNDPGRNEMMEIFKTGDDIWIGEDITISIMSSTKTNVVLKIQTPKRKKIAISKGVFDDLDSTK